MTVESLQVAAPDSGYDTMLHHRYMYRNTHLISLLQVPYDREGKDSSNVRGPVLSLTLSHIPYELDTVGEVT